MSQDNKQSTSCFEKNWALAQRKMPALKRIEGDGGIVIPQGAVLGSITSDFVVFLGMNSFIPAAFSQTTQQKKYWLIIENSPHVFFAQLRNNDWSSLLESDHVFWAVDLAPKQLKIFFRDFLSDLTRLIHSKAALFIETPQGWPQEASYKEVPALFSEVRADVLQDVQAPPEDNYRGLINLMGNMNFLNTGFIDPLEGQFSCPGIVVSTGPSLNSVLPYLSQIQDRALIFSVDSALPVLLKAGIEPHFVGCIERVVATEKLFDGLPNSLKSTLVTLPLIYPETFKKFPGPKLWALSRGMGYEWLLGQHKTHYLGNSASTLALSCLNFFGCDPLILVGQDLAFDRTTLASHAQGAASFLQEVGSQKMKEVQQRAQPENWVIGNNDTPLLSWEPYRLIAKSLERIISQSQKKCFNVIESSRGMKLIGPERQNPEWLLTLPLMENNPWALLEPLLSKVSGVDQAWANLTEAAHFLFHLKSSLLENMEEHSRFFHENIPNIVTSEVNQHYLALIKKLESNINHLTDQPQFQSLVWPFVMGVHVELISSYYEIRLTPDDFKKRTQPLFEILGRWFATVFYWVSRLHYLLCQQVREGKV